jgi:hypothetical protein
MGMNWSELQREGGAVRAENAEKKRHKKGRERGGREKRGRKT